MWGLLHKITRRIGVYHRLRYSSIYYFILRFRNPQYIKTLNHDLHFYRKALGDKLDLVFDVGANNGDKAWVFRQISNRVVCVEPDAGSFTVLSARYGRDPRVFLERAAVGDREGELTLFVEAEGSAFNTVSEKWKHVILEEHKPHNFQEVTVLVTTLERLIAKYSVPDFLKIDVEGYELPALLGLNRLIPVISFEANLPFFREETMQIVNRLLQQNRSALFNLRGASDFIFPSYATFSQIRSYLETDSRVTYDVFVYNR